MTDAPAAILATFCGMRTVASRKVALITMEVPIEQMGSVLTTLGPPSGIDPQWVAIALLTEEAAAQAQGAKAPVIPTKDKRRFSELPYSQQAALRGEDGAFRKFLSGIYHEPVPDAEAAAKLVRDWCSVNSRALLDTQEDAAASFADLLGRYDAWMRAA